MFSVEIKIAVGGMSERIQEMKSMQGYSDGGLTARNPFLIIIAELQSQPEAHGSMEDPGELPLILMATPQVCISRQRRM